MKCTENAIPDLALSKAATKLKDILYPLIFVAQRYYSIYLLFSK
jgi:hypothetical protein